MGEIVKSISPVNNINNIFYDYAAQAYSVIHLCKNVNIVAAARQSSTSACLVLDDEGKNITGSYYDFSSNGPYYINLNKINDAGSYTGTGEYGKDYPVKITLPFEPMPFFVAIKNDSGGFGESRSAYWWKGNTELMYINSNVGIQVIKNTISWFDNSSASNQFNATGTPYTYFALGC